MTSLWGPSQLVTELGLIPAIKMCLATAPHVTHEGDELDHGWLAVPAPLPTPRGCLLGWAGLPIACLSRGHGDPVLLDQEWEELRALGSMLGAEGVRQLGGPEGTGPGGWAHWEPAPPQGSAKRGGRG